MGFVQIIKLTTDRFAELEAAHEQWLAATEGQRTTTREVICTDRDNPNQYWIIVEFPDYDAAMRNSELPATQEIAAKMAALCTDAPQFINLDVVRTE